MRPIPRSPLLLALAAGPLLLAPALVSPAAAQMSPPPHPLGTLPAGAPAPAPTAPSYARPAPAPANPNAPIARPGNDIGTGQSLPLSDKAGNIGPGDTRHEYAARLPSPDVNDNAAPRAFLEAARNALASGQTGLAQEALERAETRLLIRSVKPSQANIPSGEPVIRQIAEARHALGNGDRAGCLDKINAALANPELAQRTR